MALEYIRQLLLSAGLINTTIGDLQTDKDACVSLFSAGGKIQSYFGNKKIDMPNVKVVVRDISYSNGLSVISTIQTTLTNYHDSIILGMWLTDSSNYLGHDDKKRNVWELGFKVNYEEV